MILITAAVGNNAYILDKDEGSENSWKKYCAVFFQMFKNKLEYDF